MRSFATPATGEATATAKLSEEDVVAILEMLREEWPLREIARSFGVIHGTIQAIKDGRTWKHIPRT